MPFFRPSRAEPLPLRLLGDVVDLIVVALGAVMISLMFLNVLARLALDVDVAANVELGELMLVWATFLGGVAACRRSTHMRITEVVEALPPPLRRWLELAIRVGVLSLLGALVWHGGLIALQNMEQQTTVLYWPVGLTYAALPVGAALMAVYVAWEAWQLLRGEIVTDAEQG